MRHRPTAAFALLLLLLLGCDAPPEPRLRPEGAPEQAEVDLVPDPARAALVSGTRRVEASGASPVWQVLPGPAVHADRVSSQEIPPDELARSLFSDVVRPSEGDISIAAIDRTSDDPDGATAAPPALGDEAYASGWFRGADGARYDFRLVRLAPAAEEDEERRPTHFGGVAVGAVLHGDTGVGTPLLPLVRAAVAIWGVVAVERDGTVVGEFPAHIMVCSRTRSPETGRSLGLYHDAVHNSIDEVHLIVSGRARSLARHVAALEGTLPAGAPREDAREEEEAGPGGVPGWNVPRIERGDAPGASGYYVVWGHARWR